MANNILRTWVNIVTDRSVRYVVSFPAVFTAAFLLNPSSWYARRCLGIASRDKPEGNWDIVVDLHHQHTGLVRRTDHDTWKHPSWILGSVHSAASILRGTLAFVNNFVVVDWITVSHLNGAVATVWFIVAERVRGIFRSYRRPSDRLLLACVFIVRYLDDVVVTVLRPLRTFRQYDIEDAFYDPPSSRYRIGDQSTRPP